MLGRPMGKLIRQEKKKKSPKKSKKTLNGVGDGEGVATCKKYFDTGYLTVDARKVCHKKWWGRGDPIQNCGSHVCLKGEDNLEKAPGS